MRRYRGVLGSLLIVAAVMMGGRDYFLAKADKPPEFSMLKDVYKDGGTKVYIGLGYKVIDYNQLNGRKDVAFIPFYVDQWELK
ncbi:hypothetical protein A8F94_15620 [Bacillus sp. FJAT-27225]|uniref:hypothetical protein n=1 Tax=Bacillus sp. FJAT-27225 TaxID=1743144 RepID=UPI00080C21E8|nr:hypothetical protein [Bacillus sp. FJAT-27225]OCA84150.1 hypothetical protein A8F94_15620 [Bacillus sp. FJAT-27225]